MSSEAREVVTEYIEATGDGRFDRVEELMHEDVRFGGTIASELRGARAVVEALRRLDPILVRNDIKQVIAEGNEASVLYEFVTETEVGPVLSAEFLTLEEGGIRSITLLFDWRRWPEVVEELGRRTAPPQAVGA